MLDFQGKDRIAIKEEKENLSILWCKENFCCENIIEIKHLKHCLMASLEAPENVNYLYPGVYGYLALIKLLSHEDFPSSCYLPYGVEDKEIFTRNFSELINLNAEYLLTEEEPYSLLAGYVLNFLNSCSYLFVLGEPFEFIFLKNSLELNKTYVKKENKKLQEKIDALEKKILDLQQENKKLSETKEKYLTIWQGFNK